MIEIVLMFNLMAKEKISVDIILQSIGRNNTKDISFTIGKDDLQTAMDTLQAKQDLISFDTLSYDDDIAKLSIVGAGMASNPGVASMMFEALYDCGVNINMISTSEIKISVLLKKKYADKAMVSVHDKFMSNQLGFHKEGK